MAIIIVQVQSFSNSLVTDYVWHAISHKNHNLNPIQTLYRNVRWIWISIVLWKIHEKISWWTWTWIWMSRWKVLVILWCIMDQVQSLKLNVMYPDSLTEIIVWFGVKINFSGEWCETSMYGNYGRAAKCKSNCDCINQVNHCVGPCTVFDWPTNGRKYIWVQLS